MRAIIAVLAIVLGLTSAAADDAVKKPKVVLVTPPPPVPIYAVMPRCPAARVPTKQGTCIAVPGFTPGEEPDTLMGAHIRLERNINVALAGVHDKAAARKAEKEILDAVARYFTDAENIVAASDAEGDVQTSPAVAQGYVIAPETMSDTSDAELPATPTMSEEAGVTGYDPEPILPSHDVKFYAPLTEGQKGYPANEADLTVNYYPGIEKPVGGTSPKLILDKVPVMVSPPGAPDLQGSAQGKGSLTPEPGLVTGQDAGDLGKVVDQLSGGPGDCALTGGDAGPAGCTILKQDNNHYEWPTLEKEKP